MSFLASDDPRARAFRRSMAGLAVVALCFTTFVTVRMFQLQAGAARDRPVDHPQIVAMRADLDREGKSEALVNRLRAEELALRERYLVHDFRLRRGAWLLLGGLVTFALAAKLGLSRRPAPALAARGSRYDPDRDSMLSGRLSVLGIAVLLAAGAAIVPLTSESEGEVETAKGIWTRFRGAGGLGVSAYEGAPRRLDAREGQEVNLRWKAVTPLPGLSSPVVWDDRVLLTGASESSREVYAFDALTGALLWRRPVSAGPESSEPVENIWEETGYAAPTPVTDGEHVWSMFANGDVVCHDLFGKEVWCRHLGPIENMYGLAASPMLLGERLILQIDQDWGSDGPRSALHALDKTTGEELWRSAREVESSWPSPIPVADANGTQILTCANPWAIAYDPATGDELWRADSLDGDGGPSPSFANGLALVVNVASPLAAIRIDGEGEVTKTHVAWEHDGELPDVCSLLAANGLVWMQATEGVTTCIDAATGELVWEHEHDMDLYASPAHAGGAVYLLGRRGEVVVIGDGREYVELATGNLGEPCDASPAFAGDRMYVRGRRHLFCFQEPDS